MLSREIEFWRQRNRFSVLLALLRNKISSVQSRCLLQIQLAADQVASQKPFPEDFKKLWLEEVGAQIGGLFQKLEVSALRQSNLDRLVHLHRHLFLYHFKEGETSKPQHR
jgi:hypothetical protein